jgi:hypothetical protein
VGGAAAPRDACTGGGYHAGAMADEHDQPLEQQLEEIRIQLAWVRDYL